MDPDKPTNEDIEKAENSSDEGWRIFDEFINNISDELIEETNDYEE